jgi:hypothetical protein
MSPLTNARQLELFPLTIEERLLNIALNPESNDDREQENDDDKFYFSKELRNTPTIPQNIYDALPTVLRDASGLFSNSREKDVFLTGAISVLSGVFSKVTGFYDRKKVHSNLFSFIVAPAASDKSAMIFGKSLGTQIHNNFIGESKQKMSEYLQKKKAANKKNSSEGSQDVNIDIGPKPQRKILFIPANSSSASVISHLEQSDQSGIIVETEADTMANTFKQDWGGYSDLLRKSFHHEPISYSRKKEDEYIEVEKPRLSVCLTGTPSQVGGLIHSASDGLFSRFLFYAYSSKQKWRDVSTTNKINLTSYFEEASKKIKNIYDMLDREEYEFDLPNHHWVLFNERFGSLLEQTDKLTGGDSASSIKRMGLMTYRIALILSVLRSFEGKLPMDYISCEDEDFGAAMLLSKIYVQHSIFMFESLKKGDEDGSKTTSLAITRFINQIKSNKSHKRKNLVEIGMNMGIQERTVDLYLKRLVDEKLLYKSEKFGEYYKK